MLDSSKASDTSPIIDFASKSIPAAIAGSGNKCFSPFSLYLALASVGIGADGEGEDELLSVLGVQSKGELEHLCEEIYRRLCPPPREPKPETKPKRESSSAREIVIARAMEKTRFSEKIVLANSLWANAHEGYSVSARYANKLDKIMGGTAQAVGFDHVARDVSSWAKKTTDGFLAPSVSMDPDDQLLVMSLLYYCGRWQDAFSYKRTRKDVFRSSDEDVETDFMYDSRIGRVFEGDGLTCAVRSLGHCQMMFFLPDEGVDVADLADTPEKVAALLATEPDEEAMIDWAVPKFDISGKAGNLADLIKSMGVRQMFKTSDMLSKMLEGPYADKAYLTQISQDTRLRIDEKGCEAAAMTAVDFACFMAPSFDRRVEFKLDRPFIFALVASDESDSEDEIGVPLCMGVVRDPSLHKR